MLKKNIYTLLFIGWVVIITILSLFSLSSMDLDAEALQIPYADKITHFVFYTVFTFIGTLALKERTDGKLGFGKTIRIVVPIALAYGIMIEVLQYMITTDRMAEFGDVLANTLGAFAGIGLIRWFFSKKNPLKWKF